MEKLVTIIVSTTTDKFHENEELKALLKDGYTIKSYLQTDAVESKKVAITVHLIKS